MRKRCILVVLFAVALACAREAESLEQLKARVDAAKPSDQVKLALEVAEHQLKAAGVYYDQDDTTQAEGAVRDVISYCEKAGAAARASHKHLKHTEIRLRDLQRKLEAIRRAVNYDDRPLLQSAIDRLEKIRADLLFAMFGTKS